MGMRRWPSVVRDRYMGTVRLPVSRLSGKKAPHLTSIAYYHCGQIGTPQELTDESGEVAWSTRYKAWGEAKEAISDAARKAGITNSLRFAGQYSDRETGLHYNRHRHHAPISKRFISNDLSGPAGVFNGYLCSQSPVG